MITACYLFTLKDTFFEFDKACDLAAQLAAGSLITQECQLPPPAIVWVCYSVFISYSETELLFDLSTVF